MSRFIYSFILMIIFSSLLFAKSIEVDETTTYQEILPYTQIFMDDTKELTFEEVKTKEFTDNNESILLYGYSPPFALWIKFTLKNSTDKILQKTLQYDHEITSNIQFFDGDKKYQEGIFNLSNQRDTLTPIFDITLQPNQSKVFYIRASSHVTPLIIKLNLWGSKEFYRNEIKHQFIFALFFGAMGVLLIYNLFIFFFTRDISYLWYVLYIFATTLHHIYYIGLIFTLSNDTSVIFMGMQFGYLIVTTPMLMLGLFTKSFLDLHKHSNLNKINNFYLIFTPMLVVINLFYDNKIGEFNMFYMSYMLYLFFIAGYLTYKRNRQAYFIVIGWFVLFSSWGIMWLSSEGVFHILEDFPYIVEIGILAEAIIFSIALADKINTLKKAQKEASDKLFLQQKNQEQKLKQEVENKTKDLSLALGEKETLLKELHHRVKNNMQMVVSLLRLQSHDIDDERLKGIFKNAQNRISAMGHLHELLYKQDSFTHINSLEYFSLLINEIEFSASDDIDIRYDIKCDLQMEDAIYCGLILNELVTNAYKYAFEKSGEINIKLIYENDKYILTIHDNGKGFNPSNSKDTLGLNLIEALVKKQLKGSIEMINNNGTQANITWSKR